MKYTLYEKMTDHCSRD